MTNKALVIFSKEPRCDVLQFYSKLSGWDVFLVAPEAPDFNLQTLGGSVTHISDEEILPRKIFRANFDASISRQNWYYQQFLKYAIVEQLGGKVLVVDGDSFLNIDSLQNGISRSKGARYVAAYDNFITECFQGSNTLNKNSYITNFMHFDASYLRKMFCYCGVSTLDAFMVKVSDILRRNPQMMFSEYQTYARFVEIKELAQVSEVRVFRRMDLLTESVEEALKTYDLVSFEEHHKSGLLRRLRASIYYAIGKTLN